MPHNYLFIEEGLDNKSIIDIMGKHGASVKLEVNGPELWVQVIGVGQAAPILLDEVLTMPEDDERDE